MSNKIGKKTATTLAVGALLTTTGCSSLHDYTVNGVPVDKLYADSEQVKTDAVVDNGEGFCSNNPWTCAVGAAVVVGGVTWAIVKANSNTNNNTNNNANNNANCVVGPCGPG